MSQARTLVERLKAHTEIDFHNDWKLLTILIGVNNLCEACRNVVSWCSYFMHELSGHIFTRYISSRKLKLETVNDSAT